MGRKNSNARSPRTPRNLHAVPYTETPAEQALIKAVTAHPNTTAKELAELAELGPSTARKILAEFAEKGMIIRTSAPGAGPGRTPDRWTLADTETAEAIPAPVVTSLPTASDDTQSTEPDELSPADPEEIPTSGGNDEPGPEPGLSGENVADEAGEPEQQLCVSGPASHSSTGTTVGHEQAAAKPAETVPEASTTPEANPRAGKNELRGKVEDYLLQHPDEEFGPHALGAALGHSSGAIANVLEKLVRDGYARRVGDSPKRYTAIPTDAAETAAG